VPSCFEYFDNKNILGVMYKFYVYQIKKFISYHYE
jgi:hypothetical protein